MTKSALASSSIAILRAPKGHHEKELRVDFFLVQEPQLGCLVVILYNHCMAYHSRSRNFQIKSAFAELKGGRSPRLAVCSASTRGEERPAGGKLAFLLTKSCERAKMSADSQGEEESASERSRHFKHPGIWRHLDNSQPFVSVRSIYHPDVHHHGNATRNSVWANHVEVGRRASSCARPPGPRSALAPLSASPPNSSGNVAVSPDA